MIGGVEPQVTKPAADTGVSHRSDYTGAAALQDGLPKAEWLPADRGYDADWSRDALKDKRINPRLPGRKSREKPVRRDKRR